MLNEYQMKNMRITHIADKHKIIYIFMHCRQNSIQ
jgi:hypothetical protein